MEKTDHSGPEVMGGPHPMPKWCITTICWSVGIVLGTFFWTFFFVKQIYISQQRITQRNAYSLHLWDVKRGEKKFRCRKMTGSKLPSSMLDMCQGCLEFFFSARKVGKTWRINPFRKVVFVTQEGGCCTPYWRGDDRMILQVVGCFGHLMITLMEKKTNTFQILWAALPCGWWVVFGCDTLKVVFSWWSACEISTLAI